MGYDSTCSHLHPDLHPDLQAFVGGFAAIRAMNTRTCSHLQVHLHPDLHPCPVSIGHGQVQVAVPGGYARTPVHTSQRSSSW